MTDDVDRSPTARAGRYDRDHARRLRALAYRMLGSRAEAEDIVQEAWLARREVTQEERDRLIDAFMHAVRGHDVSALVQLLTEDAVLLADGGGKVSALPRPLHGNALIARTFMGFAQLPSSRGWRLVPAMV